MTTPVSGDLLSAASLLATIISLLYSIWYGELKAAQGVQIAEQRADRDPAKRQVLKALLYRALPLLVSAVSLLLILFPSFIKIIRNTWHALFTPGVGATYDPVAACFVAVLFVIAILTAVTAGAAFGLIGKRRKLNK